MSKIIVKLDDGKTFSAFVPKMAAETRFFDLCRLAMEKMDVENNTPTDPEKADIKEEQTQGEVIPSVLHETDMSSETKSNEMTDTYEDIRSCDKTEPPTAAADKRAKAPIRHPQRSDNGGASVKAAARTYRGFLHIICEKCGNAFSFRAKQPMSHFTCRECGHLTPLDDLTRMTIDCECGKTWNYHTNALSELVELDCVACHSPMVAQMDKYGNYQTLQK